MITLSQLTELLGWASLINLAYLVFVTLALIFMRGTITSLHSKLLGIDEKDLSAKYFDFISIYKVVTLALIVAPYIALKIMGQ